MKRNEILSPNNSSRKAFTKFSGKATEIKIENDDDNNRNSNNNNNNDVSRQAMCSELGGIDTTDRCVCVC